MKHYLLFFLLFFSAATLQAQEKPAPPDMETDRPGQTESTKVVPSGYVQIESGFMWERDVDNGTVTNTYHYPATIIRIGVLKTAELRLKGEFKRQTEEIAATDVRTDQFGLARTGVGLKVSLWENQGARPAAALLAHATMPWGSRNYNAALAEPELIMTFSNKLTDKTGLVYSVGGSLETYEAEEWETDPRKFDRIFFYTMQVTNDFSDQLQGFLEYYGQKQTAAGYMHHLDAGLAWKILPNLQLDLLGGIGLSKDAPDFFMETGVSIRLPR